MIANADPQNMGAGAVHGGMDPTQAQYYAHSVGYNAQQHQNALKSHQQYFFQLQQRQQQHFAAQQAAWQAQYSQQGQIQLPPPNGHQGHLAESMNQPYGMIPGSDVAAQQSKGPPSSGPPNFKQEDSIGSPSAAQQQWMMYNQYQNPMQMHPQAMQQSGHAPSGAEMHGAPTAVASHSAQHYHATNGASGSNNSDGDVEGN